MMSVFGIDLCLRCFKINRGALEERKNLFVGYNVVPAGSPALQVACRNVAPVFNRVGDKLSMLIAMNARRRPAHS